MASGTTSGRRWRLSRLRTTLVVSLLVAAILCISFWAQSLVIPHDGGVHQPAYQGLAQASFTDLVKPAPAPLAERLDLWNTTRDERLTLEPFDGWGVPRPEAFERINRLFRSAKGNQIDIDPRLIQLLIDISKRFEGKQLVLISGFRDPGAGTRTTSYHAKGMAADIAVLRARPYDVYRAALRLGARGVGLYPLYVHVDVRDDVPYKWVRRY